MPASPSPTSCNSELFLELVDEIKRVTPDCYYRTRFIRLWGAVNIDYAFADWCKQAPEDRQQRAREAVEGIKTHGHQHR
jgi:hypothetical protein